MADDDKTDLPVVTVKAFGKADGNQPFDAGAIRSQALDADDEFANFFKDKALRQKVDIVQPPYNFNQLAGLVQVNNALQPCIEAMVTNIDGTGAAIRLIDPEDEDEDDPDEDANKPDDDGDTEVDIKREKIEKFFNEVFPAESFITLRKKCRRDLETVGNAYIEVMRNLEGKLVFLRHIRAKDVRLVKLDDPVNKEVEIDREGERQKVTMLAAERRFAQIVGNKIVFFKEMNATRELHRTEGVWEGSEGFEVIEPVDRANELIHLTTIPDARSPYGLPRWVPQLPSVLGSRQAEEVNLDFFNTGGIPPVLITIAGGKAAEEASKILNQFFSGQAKNKQRGIVMEVQPTGGTLDKEGNATKIEVHRFGAEQQKDSMFENYDDKSEKRVRRAFRLPPLFVGMAEDFSFATAFASYTVAEAQVFEPERVEFDEMVNNLIMPELDPEGLFEYSSLPISVNDVAQRLEAIKIALEAGGIDAEGVIDALNDLVNLELKFDPEAGKKDISGLALNTPEEQSAAQTGPATSGAAPPGPQAPGQPASQPGQPIQRSDNVIPLKRVRKAEDLVALASRVNELMHAKKGEPGVAEQVAEVSLEIAGLEGDDHAVFQSILSVMQFDEVDTDPGGLARLAGCSLAVLAGQMSAAQ